MSAFLASQLDLPITSSLLADCAEAAGLPTGVFNIVQGTGANAGAKLVADPRIARISFTGSVGTAKPTQPKNFTLGFNTAFTLAQDDPGIVNQRAKTLDAVRIQEAVEYPVPSSQRFVGPARLPFGSQLLLLKIRIRGRCFPANPNNSYNFIGEVKDCATASLVCLERPSK